MSRLHRWGAAVLVAGMFAAAACSDPDEEADRATCHATTDVGNAATRLLVGDQFNPVGVAETTERVAQLNATIGDASDGAVRDRARSIVDGFDLFLSDPSQSSLFFESVFSMLERCEELGHITSRNDPG